MPVGREDRLRVSRRAGSSGENGPLHATRPKSIRFVTRKKQRELERRGKQLKVLEEQLERLEARRRSAVMFRLHSAEHHLDCSEERFAELQAGQRRTPRLLLKNKGVSGGGTAIVFGGTMRGCRLAGSRPPFAKLDLMAALQRHLADEARAGTLNSATSVHAGISDSLRLAVWLKHGGSCADCGSVADLRFTSATPWLEWSDGPDDARSAGGVTLLCKTCSALRAEPGWGAALA